MNGLQTARVVVIDDDPNEALPLVRALSQLGIGSLYFNGDAKDLPRKPVEGIRLVFLDLRLTSIPNAEPRHFIPQTLAVLARVIPARSHELGIVLWAKLEHDADTFNQFLGEQLPELKPLFVKRISEKIHFVNDGSSLKKLQSYIEKELKDLHGEKLLWCWEQAIHNAASTTSEHLLGISGDTNNPADGLLNAHAAICQASAGSTIVKEDSAVWHLFDGLSAVHFDQLEQQDLLSLVPRPHRQALLTRYRSFGRSGNGLTPDQKARINSALLTSQTSSSSRSLEPGTVFIAERSPGARCPVKKLGLDLAEILKSINSDLGKAQNQGKMCDLLGNCKTIVIEVSPSCDFAQGKRPCPRFVGGVLVPSTQIKHLQINSGKNMYVKNLDGIQIDGLEGVWYIVLNARFLCGTPNITNSYKSGFRLRSAVLNDIQAWLAAHTGRMGYTSIR